MAWDVLQGYCFMDCQGLEDSARINSGIDVSWNLLIYEETFSSKALWRPYVMT
jgi:hypothetical protein